MNAPMIRRLIVKDWYLCRGPLLILAVAGTGSVALLLLRREVTGFVGLTSSFITLVLLSNILPIHTIVNERKRQNLPFVMSLPITPSDYTAAKIVANLVAFGVVWLAVSVGAIAVVGSAGVFGGLIPFLIIGALAPFVAFCTLVAVSLIGESELWTIVTTGAINISYSFIWFFLIRQPGVREALRSAAPVWNDTVLLILVVEISAIVIAIGAAFFFQSRKTEFI
jgi:ABC-2 type transport system permease protein